MISLESLIDVMGEEVTQCTEIGEHGIKFRDRRSMQDNGCIINIHELGHRCKEKAASTYGCYISSCAGEDFDAGKFFTSTFVINGERIDIWADTEPLAIFSAYDKMREAIRFVSN